MLPKYLRMSEFFTNFVPSKAQSCCSYMKLSIVTINYNDAPGLAKTLKSVSDQHIPDGFELEHVVIDGASTDNSVEVVTGYWLSVNGRYEVKWVSEKDKGIYNAMNKGIWLATGDYCQFLNSGDMLAGVDVIKQMFHALIKAEYPDVLYGNMRKVMADGRFFDDSCGGTDDVTLNMFYKGCLNHSPAYIRRSLFEKFGLYDESLKICSDWKFYMQAIVLGGATVRYTNVLVTIFDMGGISETRRDILNEERTRLLNELVPQGILKDYEKYHFPMAQYDRLKKHHLWGLVAFVERVLFKLEKWHILR